MAPALLCGPEDVCTGASATRDKPERTRVKVKPGLHRAIAWEGDAPAEPLYAVPKFDNPLRE